MGDFLDLVLADSAQSASLQATVRRELLPRLQAVESEWAIVEAAVSAYRLTFLALLALISVKGRF